MSALTATTKPLKEVNAENGINPLKILAVLQKTIPAELLKEHIAESARIEADQGKPAAMLKKITVPQKDSGQELMVYDVRAGEIAEKLKKLHEEFFEAYHINRKVQLKEQIDSLEWGTVNDADVGAWRAMPLRDEFLAATFTDAKQLDHLENSLSEIGFSMPVSALKEEGWNLEPPEVLALMEKLRKVGTPLGEYVKGRFYRGILIGLNEAFVIDKQTRERLIAEDPKSEELIKPWLRGRDIKKWKAEWGHLYLINIPSSANKIWPWSDAKTESKARAVFKQTYPTIHSHLSHWEDKLRKRDDQGRFWWELRSCVYDKEFERPKIMYAEIATEGKFLIDDKGYYSDTTSYIMANDSLYLLGVLNSKLFTICFPKQALKSEEAFLDGNGSTWNNSPSFLLLTNKKM